MPRLGRTDLDVFGLCLGGNVFGWTIDEQQSFAVLDAYVEAGGNFIDTADAYSAWVEGNRGGESETIIGNWMAARGNRDELVIATKAGMKPDRQGLGAATVRQAAEESLERLQTDRIDLYYAHRDDLETPQEEALAGLDALVVEGKVRHLGASNYDAARLGAALQLAEGSGLTPFTALQPLYNLVERAEFAGALQDLCVEREIGVAPYSGLASGFLTGKYRPGGLQVESVRAGSARRYLERGGEHVLVVLDEVAAAHDVRVSAVALAWLRAQPSVVSPIASARTPQQLADLLPGATLELAGEELARLDAAAADVRD